MPPTKSRWASALFLLASLAMRSRPVAANAAGGPPVLVLPPSPSQSASSPSQPAPLSPSHPAPSRSQPAPSPQHPAPSPPLPDPWPPQPAPSSPPLADPSLPLPEPRPPLPFPSARPPSPPARSPPPPRPRPPPPKPPPMPRPPAPPARPPLPPAPRPPPPRPRPPPTPPRPPPPLPPPAPPRRPPTPPSPPPSPPPPPPPPMQLPQYFIHFGICDFSLQLQGFGNWVMTRSLSGQRSNDTLTVYLDTKNTTAVAAPFGTVQPADFPITHIYFGYFNTSGVRSWSPALDDTSYKEVSSYYWIRVNGQPLTTVRDLKDSGPPDPMGTAYSLKGTLSRGMIVPSLNRYKIEVYKMCDARNPCSNIPDPARVFTSPEGYIAYSLWSVHQGLTVNGTYVVNHAWCPVQTALNLP